MTLNTLCSLVNAALFWNFLLRVWHQDNYLGKGEVWQITPSLWFHCSHQWLLEPRGNAPYWEAVQRQDTHDQYEEDDDMMKGKEQKGEERKAGQRRGEEVKEWEAREGEERGMEMP